MLKIAKLLNNKIKSTRSYCKSVRKPPWNVLFFGADDFSLYSLKALSQEYRKGKLVTNLEVTTTVNGNPNPIRQYAEKEGLKLHKWPMQVPKDTYDVGLVVSFGHLIPENIINKFQFGMLNVHASLLPRWRGAAPIIYALAKGDTQTGVTIMTIKPQKFDVGDIICQASVNISQTMVMPELYEILGQLGARYLVDCLEDLPAKLQNARKQPENGVTYAPRVNTSFSYIHWPKMTSEQIYNLARALIGFQPLSTTWKQIPVKLIDINLCPEITEYRQTRPGFVEYDQRKKILRILCCNQAWIAVKQVKILGKKVMSASDFNNGYLKKVTPEHRFFE